MKKNFLIELNHTSVNTTVTKHSYESIRRDAEIF